MSQTNYISHMGVFGMKHGKRRYQNPDGTWTELGKERRREQNNSTESRESKKVVGIVNKRLKDNGKSGIKKNEIDAEMKKRMAEEERKKQEKLKAENEAKERAKLKQRVLESRSAAELYKHAELFSTDELREQKARLELERDIKRLAPEVKTKGQQAIEKLQTTKEIFNRTADAVDSGTKAYNNVAKVLNALNGDGNKLPIIGESAKRDVVSTTSNYDRSGKLTSKTVTTEKASGGRNVDNYDYSEEKVNKPTPKTNEYKYDSKGRVTSATKWEEREDGGYDKKMYTYSYTKPKYSASKSPKIKKFRFK